MHPIFWITSLQQHPHVHVHVHVHVTNVNSPVARCVGQARDVPRRCETEFDKASLHAKLQANEGSTQGLLAAYRLLDVHSAEQILEDVTIDGQDFACSGCEARGKVHILTIQQPMSMDMSMSMPC